ncbi:sensor domain-containing protein [Aliamphritea hakodatensis]|uniref:sensor domain-containing protein n=1 Tax=Aliamphritea hakodatensis TaxID=2895352 RepID=UPI0022FD441A|nr:EAL domain-containing protein [Aliamphritea hakodatensis]
MIPLRQQLGFRNFILALIMMLALSLASSAVQIYSDWQATTRNMENQVHQTLGLLEESAIQAAYQLDRVLAQRIVVSLMKTPSIFKAEIKDDWGNRLAETERPVMNSSVYWYDNNFIERYRTFSHVLTLPDKGIGVGSLEVSIDQAEIMKDFTRRSWQVVYIKLIESLITATLFFGVFFFFVTRPIINITHNIAGLNTDPEHPELLDLPNRHKGDELGFLIKSFNNMLDKQLRIERSLTDSEAYFRAVMEQASDGIFLLDCEGQLLDVNASACYALKHSKEELLSCSLFDICNEKYHDDLRAMIKEADFNTSITKEVEMYRRDKSINLMEIRTVQVQINGQTCLLSSARNIGKRKSAEERIKYLAFYDSLTDLPNRQLLNDRITQALRIANRHDHTGGILFLDLDRFKLINDSLGHSVGDNLLKQVALRLKSSLRSEDTVARLGGDEFVILVPEIPTEEYCATTGIQHLGQKILQLFKQPFIINGHKLFVSTSVGITLFPQAHAVSIDDLLRQADTAMYQSKRQGRNQLCFYQQQLQESVNERLTLEKDLHHALENEEFELFYQPQVNVQGQLIGMEALLRWRHPQHGLVAPDNFIGVAEETGLILPIGKWVLEEAFRQLISWQAQSLPESFRRLSINISPKQFIQPDFVDQLESLQQLSGIDSSLICLELTENMLIENIEAAAGQMRRLKALGVHLSIDDFGTGYSSLRYLKTLPLNELKIDKSFVHDIRTDASSLTIVETIIAMANSLDLEIIAEGVETQADQELLESLGCLHFQGYLYSRPVPAAECADMFTAEPMALLD